MDEFTDSFQESAEQLAQATHDLTEKTTETADRRATALIPTPAPATYTMIIQQQTNPDHTEIVVRKETVDKQILIQREKNTTDNTLARE